MLITGIESGADAVGTSVLFLAKADVVDAAGNVVVAKGAVAYGKVVVSHGARGPGSLRAGLVALSISIDDTTALDGQKVKLSAVRSGLQTSPLPLNAQNTSGIRKSESLDRAWAQPSSKKDLVVLAQLIGSSKNSDLADNPVTAGLLGRIAGELNLPVTSTLRGPRLYKVASLLGEIGTGRTDTGALGRAGDSQIGAVIELVQVLGYVLDRLAPSARPAIRARVGTPFVGYVIEDVKVQLPGRG